MRLLIFILLFGLFKSNFIYSQNLEINWSEKINETNQSGFSSTFLNVNENFLYVLFTSTTESTLTYKIVSFDKKSMQKMDSLDLINPLETSLTFFKAEVQKDNIYVFWNNTSDKIDELYVESFDVHLKRHQDLLKLASFTCPIGMKKHLSADSKTQFVVLSNKSEVLIGSEIPQLNDSIIFRFAYLESNLSLGLETEIKLPTKLKDTFYGLGSEYYCLENGGLVIKSFASPNTNKGELDVYKKTEMNFAGYTLYKYFTYVNTTTGKTKNIELKDSEMVISDLKYIISGDKIKIYGLFYEIVNDIQKRFLQGLFYTIINTETLENEKIGFNYFDSETLQLFFGENANLALTTSNNSSPIAAFENRLNLENILSLDSTNVVLMFTHTSYGAAYSGNSGTIQYHKKNILPIKYNDNGKIIWTSSITRSMDYYNQNFKDVFIATNGKKVTILYGIDEHVSSLKLNNETELNTAKNHFMVVDFDYETGNSIKREVTTNEGVESKDHLVYIPSITLFDNTFYTQYSDMLYDKERSGNLGMLKPF
jgi:hypothetical protein